MNKPFNCSVCSKAYSYLKNLRFHVKQSHPGELDQVAPLPQRRYSCSFCDKQYNSKQYLNSHERNSHAAFYVDGNKYTCPLCDFSSLFKKKLFEHFHEEHKIELEIDERVFNSHNDFSIWKEHIERETNAKFVQRSGCHPKRVTQLVYYECHRSGIFKSKSSGLRRLKNQGSKKIGGLCPASMTVTLTNTTVKVRFTKTHVGHRNDIGHLSLTNSERNLVAEKIALGTPFDCILDEVHDSVNVKPGVSKLNMLTKRDLHNIKQQVKYFFKLEEQVQDDDHDESNDSIDSWVLKLEQHNSSVLLYKPIKCVIDDVPTLKLDDFILVIMSEVQKNMLRLYGSNIFIDRSHTIKQHNLEVVTLLVLDELNQGFPCSYLITNRCDDEILKIFFLLIKDNFGILSPNVFISPVSKMFFNSFTFAMNVPKKRLFGSWYVDHEWRKNLNMIQNHDKSTEIYILLRKLLQENNVNTFEVLLTDAINKMLLDPDTMGFGAYFCKTFSQNVKIWAACHNPDYSLCTYLHLEALHKTIRNICFQSQNKHNLNMLLNMLMNFIQDRIDNGLLLSSEEKVSEKLKRIAENHEASLKLTDIINKDSSGWRVTSNTYADGYFIVENNENCKCNMMCVSCGICLHKFCCSCQDSRLKLNMCIHTHLLFKYISRSVCEDADSNTISNNNIKLCNLILMPYSLENVQLLENINVSSNTIKTIVLKPVKITKELPLCANTKFENTDKTKVL